MDVGEPERQNCKCTLERPLDSPVEHLTLGKLRLLALIEILGYVLGNLMIDSALIHREGTQSSQAIALVQTAVACYLGSWSALMMRHGNT